MADVIDALDRTPRLLGKDHVAIGTDLNRNHLRPNPWPFCANRDKGTGRTLTEFGQVRGCRSPIPAIGVRFRCRPARGGW